MVLMGAHNSRGDAARSSRLLLLSKIFVLGATQFDTIGTHLASEVILAVRLTFEFKVVAILEWARTVSADKAIGVVLRVQGGHTDLVYDWLVAASAIRSKKLNVTRSAVSLAIVFVVSFGIIGHDLVAMLTREMLRMPGFAQCSETFLDDWRFTSSTLG